MWIVPKHSQKNALHWYQTRYNIPYQNHLSDCMICRIPSIWSSWWKQWIHSLGQLVEFTIIDHIVYPHFVSYSSLFIIVLPQLTRMFHSPLQYLLFRVIYCCQKFVAPKKYTFGPGCLYLPFYWFSNMHMESKARKIIMYHL